MNRIKSGVCLLALLLPAAAGAESVFLAGELGQLRAPAPAAGQLSVMTDQVKLEVGAQAFAERFVAERLNAFGNESLQVVRSRVDELGSQHVRLQQHINGLPVFGAELMVHTDGRGRVYAVNGDFIRGADVLVKPTLKGADALAMAVAVLGLPIQKLEGKPELTYVRDPETGEARLAWHAMVSYVDEDQAPQRDHIFADATTGALIDRVATFHTARNRRTHTANYGSSLPGTLLCTETQTCSDAAANAAHVNAGTTYNYYSAKHGRDSLNDSGLTLTSSVHYLTNYNNAGWTGSQMIYGDGDGTTFSYLSNSLDVVAHELTHGVTQYESNLIYNRESGALNEAWSDIFGAATEIYNNGGTINSNTWKLGESIYTPGISGDALRYMNNPTQDGYSKDYYPERLYPGSCTPSSSNDNCGVHGNSGIANLAFKLLVTGGTHPRGKTTASVTAIGITQAEKIFYRAQTTYLTSSSNFTAARTATAQAATDLYGSTVATTVETAWCAVGVGSCPGSGGGSNPCPTCEVYTGSLSGTGASAVQPNGTYYYSSAGLHKGYLRGPTSGADFDLYLYRWNGSSWSQVASGLSSNSSEDVTYNGSSGYYYWKILSYSGSGSYTFYLDRP